MRTGSLLLQRESLCQKRFHVVVLTYFGAILQIFHATLSAWTRQGTNNTLPIRIQRFSLGSAHCARPEGTTMKARQALCRSSCSFRLLSSSSTTTSATLHTEHVGDNQSTIFLHGLLGNGKNLKTMAQRMGGGHLVDLRGHGNSQGSHFSEPHSFVACAHDVEQTFETNPPKVIVGHSFGGRVALEATAARTNHHNNDSSATTTTWLLDTVPGQAHDSVLQVLHAVASMDLSAVKNKKDVVHTLETTYGVEPSIGQWLASSMSKSQEGDILQWGFDVELVQQLMPHFATQDFFGLVEQACTTTDATTMHLVRGGRNQGWATDPMLLPQLEKLQKTLPNFYVHVLPKAGHWVHVDDLPGLLQLWNQHQQQQQ